MARKGNIKPWPKLGEPPRGLTARAEEHFRWLETQLRPATLSGRFKTLRSILEWLEEREVTSPTELSQEIIERYQRHIYQRKKKNGDPLSASSQASLLGALKALCIWLYRNHHVLHNPADFIIMPKFRQRLPRGILKKENVLSLLLQPDTSTNLGLRDRTILEILYATGIRRTELVHLDVTDISFTDQTAHIRDGKGGKDRIVPLGERATKWLRKYLEEVRSKHASHSATALFVAETGDRISPGYLTHRLGRYMRKAGLEAGACHILRHSMATSMLENGADTRFIQEILGHANLSTTQIYTRVSIQALKEVHKKTHPLGHLEGGLERARGLK